MKKRLFIALNATDPLATSFLPTFKKLKIYADRRDYLIKWVPVENFHITVSFLGETDAAKIPELIETLRTVSEGFAPFDLKIEDLGAFSHEHDARVLWLGVQNKRCLNEYKNYLDQSLIENGLIEQLEDLHYKPHLTIGRLRNPRSVKDMISPFKRKSFGKIQVQEIVLYESILQGNYPIYKPIFRAPLLGQQLEQETEQHEELAQQSAG